jgi:hypothetical protein
MAGRLNKNPMGVCVLAFVEVPSNHIDEMQGVSSKTGRAYHMRRQTIYLHQGETYPEKYELSLEERQPAYEPGRYLLAAGSFVRDRTSNLSFGRNIKLLPFAEAVTKINEFTNPGRTRPAAAAA